MELGPMKLAILNDTHTGIRNSSDIFIQYQERFYLDVFFPYLREHGIKNIIHLGDAFEHRRFINFKALSAYRHHFLSKLREYGIHMDIIPGNHDVAYKNTNELCSLKELMGHYMNEITIHMDPTVLDFDGMNLGLVPWITRDNEEQCLEFLRSAKADVIGGHFELIGFDMLRGVPCTDGMKTDLLKRFETVLSGHYHCKSHQDNIHYLGSQMEFFWNDAHDDKFFHVFDTETRELLPVRNPLTLFERIYYDDEKQDYSKFDVDHLDDKFVKVVVKTKSDPFTFDRFLDRIQSKNIYDLKIQEDFTEFVGENVADSGLEVTDTPELLKSYVDNVETVLDKERLKKELVELMFEAESVEIA
jgi:DNA repair exonuclease SbcCD nuclease subunit